MKIAKKERHNETRYMYNSQPCTARLISFWYHLMPRDHDPDYVESARYYPEVEAHREISVDDVLDELRRAWRFNEGRIGGYPCKIPATGLISWTLKATYIASELSSLWNSIVPLYLVTRAQAALRNGR